MFKFSLFTIFPNLPVNSGNISTIFLTIRIIDFHDADNGETIPVFIYIGK